MAFLVHNHPGLRTKKRHPHTRHGTERAEPIIAAARSNSELFSDSFRLSASTRHSPRLGLNTSPYFR